MDEIAFVARLLMRLSCKVEHMAHYPSRRTNFCSTSWMMQNGRLFAQTHNLPYARLYTEPDEQQVFAQFRPNG